MQKSKTIGTILLTAISLIADLITIIGVLASVLLPDIESIPSFGLTIETRIAFIAILTLFSVVGLYFWKKKVMHIDPKLKHLSIHYSSKKDSPTTPNPKIPYYIKNQKTNQAYWVSDLISGKVKQKRIQYFTYNNKGELDSTFKSQGVNINDEEPTDKELGLLLRLNGKLVPLEAAID